VAVRTNFLENEAAALDYISGVKILKHSGRYDNYIRLHLRAVQFEAAPGINGAHMGAAFLPWHRAMLHAFEIDLQRVLDDADFGLPYWDWSADAELPDPTTSAIWSDSYMGGSGDPIDGPFTNWQTVNESGRISTNNIERDLGASSSLPTYASIAAILGNEPYDVSPYSTQSKYGFRNALEGFLIPQASAMHNAVHDWIGGQMSSPPVAPNDPVFFLLHANVDRIWALWQSQHPSQTYFPVVDGAPTQRLEDVLFGYPIQPTNFAYTPASVWSISTLGYSYDNYPAIS